MSITDELRKSMNPCVSIDWLTIPRSQFESIADRIDEEHFDALVGRSEIGVQAVLSDPEQYGLVALPRDADGEVIHIGDVMEWIDLDGETLMVKGVGNGMLFYTDCGSVKWTVARNKRHYHEPTVEDVLREFADEMNQNLGMYTGEAIDADEWRSADNKTIAEFAAKLRLVGDAS